MTASGFHPTFTITNAITEALTRIERARGFLEGATLSEEWIRRMGERALGYVMEHGKLVIQDYERLCSNTNRRTLQRDLKDMLDKGLLSERGTSPTDPTKSYQLAVEIYDYPL